jgi:hypothetical protein
MDLPAIEARAQLKARQHRESRPKRGRLGRNDSCHGVVVRYRDGGEPTRKRRHHQFSWFQSAIRCRGVCMKVYPLRMHRCQALWLSVSSLRT